MQGVTSLASMMSIGKATLTGKIIIFPAPILPGPQIPLPNILAHDANPAPLQLAAAIHSKDQKQQIEKPILTIDHIQGAEGHHLKIASGTHYNLSANTLVASDLDLNTSDAKRQHAAAIAGMNMSTSMADSIKLFKIKAGLAPSDEDQSKDKRPAGELCWLHMVTNPDMNGKCAACQAATLSVAKAVSKPVFEGMPLAFLHERIFFQGKIGKIIQDKTRYLVFLNVPSQVQPVLLDFCNPFVWNGIQLK